MRSPREVAFGAAFAALFVMPQAASSPIDQMIANVNQLLAEYEFTDHAGQVGRTSIKIVNGVLIVETAKRKGEDVFTNIWRAPVNDLDADDMRLERVGSYTELVIASHAAVVTQLRSVTGGFSNTWSLPAARAVKLQFAANEYDALEVQDRMAELVLAAQSEAKAVG